LGIIPLAPVADTPFSVEYTYTKTAKGPAGNFSLTASWQCSGHATFGKNGVVSSVSGTWSANFKLATGVEKTLDILGGALGSFTLGAKFYLSGKTPAAGVKANKFDASIDGNVATINASGSGSLASYAEAYVKYRGPLGNERKLASVSMSGAVDISKLAVSGLELSFGKTGFRVLEKPVLSGVLSGSVVFHAKGPFGKEAKIYEDKSDPYAPEGERYEIPKLSPSSPPASMPPPLRIP
jgi:hypothetical protein